MAIELHTFPRDDERFRARVVAGLATVPEGDDEALHDAIARLLTDLRLDYPLVRIRRRDRLASLDDEPVLYAYRDGDALGIGAAAGN